MVLHERGDRFPYRGGKACIGKHEEGSRKLKLKFEELLSGLGVQGFWKVTQLSKFQTCSFNPANSHWLHEVTLIFFRATC